MEKGILIKKYILGTKIEGISRNIRV